MLITIDHSARSFIEKGFVRAALRAMLFVWTISPFGCGPTPPAATPSSAPEHAQSVSGSAEVQETSSATSHSTSEITTGATEGQDASPVVEVASITSFRPPDLRLRHDAERLSMLGIHEYKSRRLLLYTDIDSEIAATLPEVIDQAFEAWEAYFGPLPPARDGSDYQLTGYIMRDQTPFRKSGLLPLQLAAFAHGKHDGQQFWMNESEFEYYRRHLMIHEATHCFMQSMGGTTRDVPVWYLEGMAELFATHMIADDGSIEFCVMPDIKDRFIGFGRIQMIQRAIADGPPLTFDEMMQLQPEDFVQHNESYAWAWAACKLASTHPRYRDLFQQLGREYVAEGFQHAFTQLLGPVLADIDAEWTLFARDLCYGFDIERAAILFQPGIEIDAPEGQHPATILASRGWQSSGMKFHADDLSIITASGRAVLAQSPRPWETEPQGISIRWNEGVPIGRLIGVMVSEPDPDTGRRLVGDVIEIGTQSEFTEPFDGTLYLRINDFWDELEDNTGEYSVSRRVISNGN